MNDHIGIAIKFLAFFLLCMKYNVQIVSGGGDGEIRCIERERDALLRFKKGLTDYYGRLSSWGSEDDKIERCKWQGVCCSNTTGHVIALLLGFTGNYQPLRGKISSALLDLHHLSNLDLSINNFGGIRIPEFICSIKNLELLNLQRSNFSGIVPPQLGNLTNLRSLELSLTFMRFENLNWLSSLPLLSRLDWSLSNLNGTNWLQSILKLHSLRELYLQDSNIGDVIIPSSSLFSNHSSTSLSILVLSWNELTSSTFDWLFNISTNLVKIDLSGNFLGGPIPNAFERLIFLEYLDLSNNRLEGEIPKSLGNLIDLQTLSLSHNQVTGSVPVSLGKLCKLEVLDISFNLLEGKISEINFMELHNLEVLDLSFNSLIIQIAPDWNPPFQLYAINLACCRMGAHFPKWIQTQNT